MDKVILPWPLVTDISLAVPDKVAGVRVLPVEFPMRSWPSVKDDWPVPPLLTPSTPESALIDGEVVEVTKPLVAWRKPLSELASVVAPATFNVPVAVRFPPRKVLPATSSRLVGEVVPMPTFL